MVSTGERHDWRRMTFWRVILQGSAGRFSRWRWRWADLAVGDAAAGPWLHALILLLLLLLLLCKGLAADTVRAQRKNGRFTGPRSLLWAYYLQSFY